MDGAFSEIELALHERIVQMIWCNMSTMDTHNRLRSRIVQPIWDGAICWIASHRHGLKAKHIAHNPFVSLAYIGDNVRPVYIDGTAAWADDLVTKQHVWNLARTAPEPLTYDLAPLYRSADNPNFGVLKLTPWRIELGDMMGAGQVWRARKDAQSG